MFKIFILKKLLVLQVITLLESELQFTNNDRDLVHISWVKSPFFWGMGGWMLTGSGWLTTGLVFVFEVPGLQYPHRQTLQMIVVTQGHQKLAFVGRRLYNKPLKSWIHHKNNVIQEGNSFALDSQKGGGWSRHVTRESLSSN